MLDVTRLNLNMTAEITALKQKARVTATTMSSLQAEKTTLTSAIEAQKNASKQLVETNSELRSDIDRRDARIEGLEQEVGELEDLNDTVAEDAKTRLKRDHKITIDALKVGQKVQLENANKRLEEAKILLEDAKNTYASEMGKLEQELDKAKQDHKSCDKDAKTSKTQINQLSQKIKELEAEVKLLQEYASAPLQERFDAWRQADTMNADLHCPINFDVEMTMVQYLQRHFFESEDDESETTYAPSDWATAAYVGTVDDRDHVAGWQKEAEGLQARLDAKENGAFQDMSGKWLR